jgi:methionyl-tRNA formyltransferase
MRVVFLGKHKRSAARALEFLVENGCEVVAVEAPEPDATTVESQRVDLVAKRHGLRLAGDEELYAEAAAGALGELDLVVSFLHPRRILAPLIELPRVACLNFHPAPLPDLRGLGGFNVAILEGLSEYGVSAHHVADTFDTGDLVEVHRFPIDADRETAWSLDLRSQEALLSLFERVIGSVLAGEELPRTPQGEGRYVNREEFESLRVVRPGDAVELTARRIRAFWYPPYEGAVLEVDGERYTLVDGAILDGVARRLRDSGEVP